MNKMSRIFVCAIFIGLCFFSVTLKRNEISEERNAKVESFISEWQEKGKPVEVEKVARKDIDVQNKITIIDAQDGSYKSFVTRDAQQLLRAGQSVAFFQEKNVPVGEIVEVSEQIDMDTGMYLVRVTINEKPDTFGHPGVVCVNTGRIKNVICVPAEILVMEDDKCFVWTNKNGHAFKKPVVVGKKDGYGAIIENGLQEGELVVVKGFTKLFENDKLNVIDDNEVQGDIK